MADSSSSQPQAREGSPTTVGGRWKTVVRSALLQHKKRSGSNISNNNNNATTTNTSDANAPPDLFGKRLAHQLNRHEAWKYHNDGQHEEESQRTEPSFTPLLSFKTFANLIHMVLQILTRPAHVLSIVYNNYLLTLVRYRRQGPSAFIWVLLTLLWATFGCAFAVAYMEHVVIMFLGQFLFLILGPTVLTLLIDVEQMMNLIPKPIIQMTRLLIRFARFLDGWLLRGYQHVGREWNEDTFLLNHDGATHKSRYLSLLKCPPPSSTRTTLPSQSSHDTAKHVEGIRFVHKMLKNEKNRKRAKATAAATTTTTQAATNNEHNAAVASDNHNATTNSAMDNDDKSTLLAQQPELSIFQQDLDQLVKSHSADECTNNGSRTGAFSDDASTIRRTLSDSDGERVFSDLDDDYDDDTDDHFLVSSPLGQRSLATSEDLSESDMNWAEVGAKIGMRILSSEHVQRAVASQDTAERILDISKKVQFGGSAAAADVSDLDISLDVLDTSLQTTATAMTPIRAPVHSMWTSAAALAPSSPRSDSESPVKSSHHVLQLPPRSPIKITATPFEEIPNDQQQRRVPVFSEWSQEDAQEERNNDSTPLQSKLQQDCVVEQFVTDEIRTEMENRPMLKKERPFDLHVQTTTTTPPPSSPERPQHKRRPLLKPGVKIVVPMFPIQPGNRQQNAAKSEGFFQMATVVSSTRLYMNQTGRKFLTQSERRHTNCLSVLVNLDKSFLRDGRFAQMTVRIMDGWSDRYMPRHSKFPIGSCVATSFGVGVLVGWRVDDDCHVVRALWKRRGPGSANAYLNRDSLHGIVEAAVGFQVEIVAIGKGVVMSYVNAGKDFMKGRYYCLIKEGGRHKGQVLEFNRCDILACHGPEFVPVIELIREAAQYQIQVDSYELALRRQTFTDKAMDEKMWRSFSKGFNTIWAAFIKAVEEDEGFDNGVNEFFSKAINFLEELESPDNASRQARQTMADQSFEWSVSGSTDGYSTAMSYASTTAEEKHNPYAWFVDDLFGGVFGKHSVDANEADEDAIEKNQWNQKQYDRAYEVIHSLMRTVSIARADCKTMPNLKLALSIVYEFLIFVRQVIRVQQKNVSQASMAVWDRAIQEIFATFGPVKTRLEKIGQGIAERVQKHGNRAKVRIIRLVDIIVSDEKLLLALEHGEWDTCIARLEQALVQARIIDEESRENYHKTIEFVINHFSPNTRAAARNNRRLAHFGIVLKCFASPRRSILALLCHDTTLEILQRIFVRVFREDPAASRMITIHAANMTTLRQLRMLKDFTIAGKLWIPILDAAEQELSWAVSRMPQKTMTIMEPISKLVSLGVAQFHKLGRGDLTADWLEFLMEDEAIKLIHEIDLKLITQLESVSRDVREVMVVLPYYPSIDDDILDLMDEVDIDEFLKEASEAIVDADRLADFIREKSTIAIRRFLDYLPRMSIPMEKRELSDGWVLTCRSETGGDLTLSDVALKRENLTAQVMGGDTLFFPMFASDEGNVMDDDDLEVDSGVERFSSGTSPRSPTNSINESSVLHQIRELLLNAQRYGCWEAGVGGVGQKPTDRYVASVLQGLVISSVLNTGIELWRSLEIDDDELLEIAIRDVSFQIQLQQQREEGLIPNTSTDGNLKRTPSSAAPSSAPRRRFNPRVDPTLLYLEMKKVTVKLDRFRFRIEKLDKTIFDPIFEGWGMLSIQNVSIKIRVECRKERIVKVDVEQTVPVLKCQELEVELEQVKFRVKDTGADWILNKAVRQFSDSITEVVETNLKDQVRLQVETALDNLNSYFAVNPDLMLSILGITIDDLEENQIWV